jgi:hypothetical protein
MSVQKWEHFFKPEVRSSGHSLFVQGKVSINQPSDTEIVVYIRLSSPFKVVFKSNSVASPTVLVDCNCPSGKKGLFCKHIWAGLLATEKNNSDFFDGKNEIEKGPALLKSTEKTKPSEVAEARELAQAVFKEKQVLYRKIQYQKQKLRQKEFKLKKNQATEVRFPNDVERALTFFSENGFELKDSMNKESIGSAKKTLSRVFHPDAGGSHVEILELNKYAEVLERYLKRTKS